MTTMSALTEIAKALTRGEYEMLALVECHPAQPCVEAMCRDTANVNQGEKKGTGVALQDRGLIVARLCPHSGLKHPTITPLGREALGEYRLLNEPKADHHRIDVGEMIGVLDEIDDPNCPIEMTIETETGLVRMNGVYRGVVAAQDLIEAIRRRGEKRKLAS